jgi:hypothetical protein
MENCEGYALRNKAILFFLTMFMLRGLKATEVAISVKF